MQRRTLFAAALAAVVADPRAALAQAYPARPLTLVVPNPPGGVVDTSTRLIADLLAQQLKGTVIVENRAGASGAMAYRHVARSPADGHTLLASYSAYHLAPASSAARANWQPADFAPVALIATAGHVIVVPASLAADTLPELIDLLRRNPGRLSYASQGEGSLAHVAAQLLQARTGTRMKHIPYRGSGPAVQDLVAGQTQMLITTPPSVLPHLRAGRLKALAFAGRSRHPALPQVPTTAEVGLPGFALDAWVGLFAPAQTPPEVLRTLSEAVRQVLAQPQAIERARNAGIDLRYQQSEALDAMVRREADEWMRLLKEAGIAPP